MKNTLIGGSPRAGKSILAQRLVREKQLSHIPLDAIVGAFDGIFPQHGIVHVGRPFGDICDSLDDFLRAYLVNLDYMDMPFALDGYHMTPKQIVRHGWHERYTVVFLGYPDISADDKLRLVRAHRNAQDWTDDIADEYLQRMLAQHIDYSRRLRDECAKTGLRFFDTGKDFKAGLESAFSYISGS